MLNEAGRKVSWCTHLHEWQKAPEQAPLAAVGQLQPRPCGNPQPAQGAGPRLSDSAHNRYSGGKAFFSLFFFFSKEYATCSCLGASKALKQAGSARKF